MSAPAPIDAAAFLARHRSALEQDEARHNLILGILERLASGEAPNLRLWDLSEPGRCAVQSPGWPLVLGELGRAHCRDLADQVRDADYPGVVGPDATARWFAERAFEHGAEFTEPIPQTIHAMRERPRYPGCAGEARACSAADASLLIEWVRGFHDEATPHDQPVEPRRVEAAAGEGRYVLWAVDDTPVSMATIIRMTRNGAAVSSVYTPPALRGRGYAGQWSRRPSSAPTRGVRRWCASTPISAILIPTAATRGSALSLCARPFTIRARRPPSREFVQRSVRSIGTSAGEETD